MQQQRNRHLFAAVKKTLYRPTIWVLENKGIYEFLGGVFFNNTDEKCTEVHQGIFMVIKNVRFDICARLLLPL